MQEARDTNRNSQRGNKEVQHGDYNTIFEHTVLSLLMKSSPFLPMFYTG